MKSWDAIGEFHGYIALYQKKNNLNVSLIMQVNEIYDAFTTT